jgi:hypothetical protein
MKNRARKIKMRMKGKGGSEKNGMEKLGQNLKETTRRNLYAVFSSSVAL